MEQRGLALAAGLWGHRELWSRSPGSGTCLRLSGAEPGVQRSLTVFLVPRRRTRVSAARPAWSPRLPPAAARARSHLIPPQDLLFSVCGLTVFSTIICTLSAVVCCIQIFSLDIVHVLVPQRSSSVTLECTSPPDTFLQSMIDFEEFVPPVPPPPYYPPEYTCSSETDAQSITYNGSMDSPVPLYPTDFPPSYETVMGLRGDSQVGEGGRLRAGDGQAGLGASGGPALPH
uniref:Uncharacterized protein n=1 Tax=Athene cunicularia TaxID=194338 RepID=A0A663N5S1_ATHCN